MEVEDPISAKFLTLIESLMAKTTSEIVKVFADVLLEMRVEISHSWRENHELKLEESDELSTEAVFRSEAANSFKTENEEVLLSEDIMTTSQNGKIEVKGITEGSLGVHQPETSKASPPAMSSINQCVNSPNQTQEVQMSHTVFKCKITHPTKSPGDTELQKSPNEIVSKSPLQGLSMVSPLQTSCSSNMDTTSPNTEALAFKTDIFAAEDLQNEETDVDEKGIPGFHHVARLAEYLVELRKVTTTALTYQQASTIIDLWQSLDTWDKQRIIYVTQHQDKLLASHFQSTEKEDNSSSSSLKSTTCDMGICASQAQRPDCCRLVEAIFTRLCDIHCSPQSKNNKTLTQWTVILQDYRKIRELVLGNDAVIQDTSLQLTEVNQSTLIQWHNHRIKDQGLTELLQEDLSQSPPKAEDPLLQDKTLPREPTQHQCLQHDYKLTESTAELKRKAIGEPPSIRPKLSEQRQRFGPAPDPTQYLQVVPHISVSTAPMLQAVGVLQPVPTFFCAPPHQNTIPKGVTQDPPKPRQKRAYNRVVQGNTCKKCGQFRTAVTGHSQYKGIVYCPQTETLDKKQWLENMRQNGWKFCK